MSASIPQYEVIEGIVSQLQKQSTHVHYLKSIKREQQFAGAVAVIQAATGQAGAILSAQIATDEGDPVEGFIMQVGEHQVTGSFWKTTFKDSDHVQVVGKFYKGVFHAVAVTKPEERMIWMQPHAERGTRAKARHLLKCSGWFVLFGYLCALLLTLFTRMPLWANLLCMSVSIPVILLVTVGMSWGDFMGFSSQMNGVGAALGLPESENLDLFKSTKQAKAEGKPDVPMGVYYY